MPSKSIKTCWMLTCLLAGVDIRNDRMQAKIRDAHNRKVPSMLVIGDKDAAFAQVSLRARSGEDLGAMPSEKFLARASKDIEELS